MRKILLSLAVLGSVAVAGGTANAAPAPITPVLDNPAHVQTVQYYAPDWRARQYWRHRRHDEWRRHEAWRDHRGWRGSHGYYGRPHFYARRGW